MAGGFQVDVEALRTTAAGAADLTGKVSELQQATYEADVPVVSWGLLGAGTAYPVYREMLAQLKNHLKEMSDGYQSIGTKLAGAADAYSSMDDEVVRAFGDIAKLLEETDAGTEAI